MTAGNGEVSPDQDYRAALVAGLSASRKSIPSRFFYDERGSALFEDITRLAEYYPTRVESGILRDHASEMAALVKPGAAVVEFGSGSSIKTETLLRAMDRPAVYVPIDISAAALDGAVARLHETFPELTIKPVVADFHRLAALDPEVRDLEKLGFFPGSTIGNFLPRDAIVLLSDMRRLLGRAGRLLIGVDLKKHPGTILAAYDDGAGVTARFNLNLLLRANRTLGATFDLAAFQHVVTYDESAGRLDMWLESKVAQRVACGAHTFDFRAGERIHTEYSHKYDPDGFARLAHEGGWRRTRQWTDPDGLFSMQALVAV